MTKLSYKNAIYFGLICSLVGLGFGIFLASAIHFDSSKVVFAFCIVLSALLVPFVIWLLLIEWPQKLSMIRGLSAGILGVALSHFVSFYLFLIIANIQYWIFGMSVTSLNEQPINLLAGLVYLWFYTVISYSIFGWITFPLGAIIGLVYSRYLIKKVQT